MQQVLSSDKLEVTIDFLGAEMSSVKNKNGLEFIWQAKKEIWPRHAPVLFPIVGKLKGGIFNYHARTYELGQHGFARDSKFSLIKSTASSNTFQLKADAASKQYYPFDFVFEIKYELCENTLMTSYKITNPSEESIFFSVGAHPGFKCPLSENESFEDYFLQVESSDFEITELYDGLRKNNKQHFKAENKKIQLTKNLFDEDALVFENSQIQKISLCSGKSAHRISMDCKNWPYFGIWSKKGCTEFICLEPWHGIADSECSKQIFDEKKGIIKLEAKKEFNCSFSLTFE